MPKQKLNLGRAWYAIHTIVGFEEMVAENIIKRAEAYDLKDKIFNAIVPKEKVWVVKGGKRELIEQKVYPGYVLVDMIVTDDAWYVVRNTPKVIGFVGIGTLPLPVDEKEIQEIFERMRKEEPQVETDFKIGDLVEITQGLFKGMKGKVTKVDMERQRLEVLVSIMQREVPVEVDFLQAKRI